MRDFFHTILNDPAPGQFYAATFTERWVPGVVQAVVPPPPQPVPRLQREGILTQEQLRMFFAATARAFDREDVKQQLRQAGGRGKGVSRLVNELQRQIFEALGVHGKYGLDFLGKLREVYGKDGSFMSEVYAFVDREQRALDEAGALGYPAPAPPQAGSVGIPWGDAAPAPSTPVAKDPNAEPLGSPPIGYPLAGAPHR